MSNIENNATRKVFLGSVVAALTGGQARVFDMRGMAQLTIIPVVAARHSYVDDDEASVHDAVTEAEVTALTTLPVVWPYVLVTVDGTSVAAGLAIDAVPEKFKTTQEATFRVAGVEVTKAATTALVFSAADTINVGAAAGVKWGIWLVQITAAGTVSTKSPSADQVYASEAAAIAAKPAPDASNIELGYITVAANDTSAWTATTDDLVAASDCSAVNFYDSTGVAAARVAAV